MKFSGTTVVAAMDRELVGSTPHPVDAPCSVGIACTEWGEDEASERLRILPRRVDSEWWSWRLVLVREAQVRLLPISSRCRFQIEEGKH